MSTENAKASGGWNDVREQVLERDGYECRFCGMSDEEHNEKCGRSLDVHHVIPRADGGEDRTDNLVALCLSCHRTLENLHAQAIAAHYDAWPEALDQAKRAEDMFDMFAHEKLSILEQNEGFKPKLNDAGTIRDDTFHTLVSKRDTAIAYHLGAFEAYRLASDQLEYLLDNADDT